MSGEMKSGEMKTFKIRCVHCQRTFLTRFALASPDADGAASSQEVAVPCFHCAKKVLVSIPSRYVASESLLRSVPSG